MAYTITNNMKARRVLFESVRHPSLPKDTELRVGESTYVFFEQNGKIANQWKPAGIGDHREKIANVGKNLKKSFLFGKYKNLTIHYVDTSGIEVKKVYKAKMASGYYATYSADIKCFVKNFAPEKFIAWAKKNDLKKDGNVWLTKGQMQNLIVNLFLEKAFEAVYSTKTTASNYTVQAWIDRTTLSEIEKVVNANLARMGIEVFFAWGR